MVWIPLSQLLDFCAEEQRPGFFIAGVPEGPNGIAIRRRYSHLQWNLDPVLLASSFDKADGARHGQRGVVLQAHGQCQVEKQLGVR